MRRMIIGIPALAAVALVAGCAGIPTPALPDETGEPTPESTAFAEAGEIGVLPDMTDVECAVAGSPWRLDDTDFDRQYSTSLIATDPSLGASSFVGDYRLDVFAEGTVRIMTEGYKVETIGQFNETAQAFDQFTTRADRGTASADWYEIDDAGSTVSLLDWSSDIVQGPPAYEDGTAYTGALPAWQLPDRPSVVFECDEDGNGLWLISTTPGYLDLHFVRYVYS